MRRAITSSLMLATAFCVGAIHAQTAPPSSAAVERQFDASLNAAEMAAWMKTMAAEPNDVGSPHNKANAEMVLAQFRDVESTIYRSRPSRPGRGNRRETPSAARNE
jgi:N-acetylated-alpha-linked acidic dipeptidase